MRIANHWVRGGGLLALIGVMACGSEPSYRGTSPGLGIDADGAGDTDEGDSSTGGDQAPDPGPDGGDSGDDGDSDGGPGPAGEDPGPELPFDADQLDRVCARNSSDRVAQALCSGATITSMADLHQVLGFEDPFFAMTGNSTSLVGADVSPINPRLIVGEKRGFADFFDGEQSDLMAMGFARGDQLVELVGFDPVADELNFYLLTFEQDCNDTSTGCNAADLVTPSVERDWRRWTVYQDVDLVNKTVDCNVCHQPLGPGTPKVLRMQEVHNSWTHWFPTRPPSQDNGGQWASGGTSTQGLPPSDETHGTRTSELLWSQFERMHGLEDAYGGVPIEQLSEAESGPDLEQFVASYLRSRELPPELQFPDGHLGGEGGDGSGLGSDYFVETGMTELTGPETFWREQFERSLSGTRLPVPSHRIDITDEFTREAAIDSYRGVLAGTTPEDQLVDPRDVASAAAMFEMSLVPDPSASAEQILAQMCSRCHNPRLDGSVSRAKFDATNLAAVSDETKTEIASRILRDHDDRYLMPPTRFGTLPQWAVDRVLAWAAGS